MSISTTSAPRLLSHRAAALFALSATIFVLLLLSWHSASASADTYPPSKPSTSAAPSSESRAPSSPAAPTSQANTNGHRDEGLSSTGFETVAATTIAVALIGGGAIFLGLGRRRHG